MSSTISFFIAEDQILFRQSLIHLLNRHDIICRGQADNGAQLMNLLKNSRADVVLLNIAMPMMSGVEAFEKIRILYPHIKVILLSNYHKGSMSDALLRKGASGVLSKETDEKALVEVIRAVHGKTAECSGADICHIPKMTFTNRDLQVISLVYQGKSNKQIASELCVVIKTVEAHKKKLFKKVQVANSIEFVKYIEEHGLMYLRYQN